MDPNVMVFGGKLLLLADLVAGSLDGAKVKLFINEVDPGPNATIDDFDLATFTGSTALVVTAWSEAAIDESGDAVTAANLMQFDYDSGDAETVYGIVLTTGTDDLLGYAVFDAPKLMDDVNDSIAVVVKVGYGDHGFGTSVRVV